MGVVCFFWSYPYGSVMSNQTIKMCGDSPILPLSESPAFDLILYWPPSPDYKYNVMDVRNRDLKGGEIRTTENKVNKVYNTNGPVILGGDGPLFWVLY